MVNGKYLLFFEKSSVISKSYLPEHLNPCRHYIAGVETYQLATLANQTERYPAISTPSVQLDEDKCLAITIFCQNCIEPLSVKVR